VRLHLPTLAVAAQPESLRERRSAYRIDSKLDEGEEKMNRRDEKNPAATYLGPNVDRSREFLMPR